MNTKKDCCEACAEAWRVCMRDPEHPANGWGIRCGNESCPCHTDSTKKCEHPYIHVEGEPLGWVCNNCGEKVEPVSHGKESSEDFSRGEKEERQRILNIIARHKEESRSDGSFKHDDCYDELARDILQDKTA